MNVLYFTPSIGNGGVEKMMYEWMIRLINTGGGYKFDIITNKIISRKYYNLFRSLADNIYEMNYHQLRLDKKIPILIKILKKGHYDIFHVHSCFSFDFWMLAIAKHFGVNVRIIHSHNANVLFRLKATKLLDEISKPMLRHYATEFMACGLEAGISLLGNVNLVKSKLIIMENGIRVNEFIYSDVIRSEVRKNLILHDKHVLGSVGRLEKQKNYAFLLKVFKEVSFIDDKAVLMLVGSGEEEKYLKEQTKKMGIANRIIFMGERNDVSKLLQCMDVFILTSIFEGLVISVLEAQCAGLPCIASNNIPKAVNVTGNVKFLSLEEKTTIWATEIVKCFAKERAVFAYKNVIEAGYDIETSTKKLDEFYKKIV